MTQTADSSVRRTSSNSEASKPSTPHAPLEVTRVGMTAQAASIPPAILASIAEKLLADPDICCVFYDLTHKPPGTIEWE